MYWFAFIGCVLLYVCIVHPSILLVAAVIVVVSYFLWGRAKKSVEKVETSDYLNHIKTSDDLSVGSDVINGKEPINEEKAAKEGEIDTVFECEPGDVVCEFIRTDEMPDGNSGDGWFSKLL